MRYQSNTSGAPPKNDDDVDMSEEQEDAEMQDSEITTCRSYQPYKFSGKSYSQDLSVEKPILDNLRRWAIDYFADNSVIHKSNYTPLKDVANI